MTALRFTEAQLEELKSRNPCDELAARWVRLRRHGRKMIGPCPICSDDRQSKTAPRFECDADGWVCAVCPDGGDVIKLVIKVERKSFPEAVEWLGGTRTLDAAEEARRDQELAARRQKSEREAASFREREREKVFEIWKRGHDIAGTQAEDYLCRLRGIGALPIGVKLRFLDDVPYYASGAKDAEVIHRGPVLLAPIMRVNAGDALARFAGLHLTYLDLNAPKGKLALRDPQTGELYPAKKVRGSKAGGHIVVTGSNFSVEDGRERPGGPSRLIIGEGLEKVLAVWRAMSIFSASSAVEKIDTTAFWTSVDLGNLGGKSAESLRHPTLTTEKGRARNVPGPAPDLNSPAIQIPDSVDELVMLGDRSSDAFLTRCALARAAARFAREGRSIRVAWSPADADFDDLLRAAA